MDEKVRVLEGLLADAKIQTAAAEEDAETARRAVTAAEDTLAGLRNREGVLRQLLAEVQEQAPVDFAFSHNGTAIMGQCKSTTPTDSPSPSLDGMTLTGAVEHIMRESDRPLGPREIADLLTAGGMPQDGTEGVRGALAWTKRKGTTTTHGRSNWVVKGSRADLAVKSGQLAPEVTADPDDDEPTNPDAQDASDSTSHDEMEVQT